MPIINGVKFACQQCITGHRSTRCNHDTRELREIKRKGRPFTQCERCRKLRETQSVHGRCECDDKSATSIPAKTIPKSIQKPVRDDYRIDEELIKVVSASKLKAESIPPYHSISSQSSHVFTIDTQQDQFHFSAPFEHSTSLPEPTTEYALPTHFSPIPQSNKRTASALFLPTTTVGTHACFCGDSCSCVGCAQHDPYSKKSRSMSKTSSLDLTSHGRREEGGCNCGMDECVGSDDGIAKLLRSLTAGGDDQIILPPIGTEHFFDHSLSLNGAFDLAVEESGEDTVDAFGCDALYEGDGFVYKDPSCCQTICRCVAECTCASHSHS